MGLDETIQSIENLPDSLSFENDGYELTAEIKEKYLKSIIGVANGQTRGEECFCRNGSIFDVTGAKIAWGDIAPGDVTQMLGVYYILSEHKSYWKPDKQAVKGWNFRSNDPNSRSPFRDFLPDFEPVVIDTGYMKKNAIARIVDGRIQTNSRIMFANYQ